ncbi:MAG: glycogen synthase, partial [Flavobacteriaceae bacterium]|nr:glycogen synthase [Flavobacteriaceae bacterium]
MFFTREYPPQVYGGAGVHVEYLSKELSKLAAVEVRYFGKDQAAQHNLVVQGTSFEDNGFETSNEQLKSVFKTLRTSIMMNANPIDADVVHCHTWYTHFAGIIAKLCYGIPLVLTTHSLEPLRPWKREQLGRGYDCSSWLEKTAIEMADAVIAVSQQTKNEVLEHFDVDSHKIKVIYNGIDLNQYVPTTENDVLERFNIPKNKGYILFVGRITRQKGIIHLVNAIRYIRPEVSIVLCAGAPDTPEIAAEMKLHINQALKERNNLFWIEEMLDKKEIIQLYSHASVFCCPSIYEPFGIINIEAMACN